MPPRNATAMTPDEREAKVAALKPQWAQDYIRQLEALTRTLHQQLTEARAQDAADLNLAREISGARDRLADGRSDQSEDPDDEESVPSIAPWLDPVTGQYAVMTVLDGASGMAPLGSLPATAEIRVAGFYQVHYSDREITAGTQVLIVEGDGPLAVRPVDPGTVIIARG